MKTQKGSKLFFVSVCGLITLILDGQTAIEGARSGLEVCFRTVIPSLFPFIFLSSLLTGSLLHGTFKSSKLVCRLFRIPYGTDGILLTGLLGGYPIGAKCVNEAVVNGQLSKTDAERMLVFCNAAGPAFLFGIAGNLFEQRWMPWCLWFIHLFSSFCMARLLPGEPCIVSRERMLTHFNVTQKLRQSVQTMAEICGWIILMRIMITMLQKWCLWYLHHTVQIFIIGVIELSNGCIFLNEIENTGLRFMLCSTFLGFGGLCVALQTNSVATAIRQKKYLPGKYMQCLISFLLAYTLQYLTLGTNQRFLLSWEYLAGILVILGLLSFFTVKRKKSSRILDCVGV